jgi:hypothetical protein
MLTSSWSPRVRTQVEFLIWNRGHQDTSRPKRITTFGWVDQRATAAAWGPGRSFRGWGGRGEVTHLYRAVSRLCFGF